MQTPILWIEHFNITPAQLESWRLEAPQEVPILFWCLSEGKVSMSEYLHFARNNYGLPSVRPEFFENYSASEVRALMTPDHSWAPWYVPLAQWEGLTYVGCVEPPSEPESSCVYVLAPATALSDFYKKLVPAEENAEATPEEAPTRIHTSLPTPTPTTSETPEGLSADMLPPDMPPLPDEEGILKPIRERDPREFDDAPTGLNVDLISNPTLIDEAPSGLSLAGLNSPTPQKEEVVADAPAGLDATAFTTLTSLNTPENTSEANSQITQISQLLDLSEKSRVSNFTSLRELSKPSKPESSSGAQVKAPEAPKVPSPSEKVPEGTLLPTQLTTMTKVTTATKMAPINGVPTAEELKAWWEDAKSQFSNCEILLGDKSEIKLIWRNGMAAEGPTLPLHSPSLFRIALRTQKPYHGYVIENDIHREYFGPDEFPKCVTAIAIPLANEKQMVVLMYGYLGQDPQMELQTAEALSERVHVANVKKIA